MEIYNPVKRRSPVRWIFFIIFALVFAGDFYLIITNGTGFIDNPVSRFCVLLRDGTLTIIAKAITFMANTTTLTALCALLVILPTRKHFGFPLAIATGLAALVHHVLKEFIERPRPDAAGWLVEVNSYSFPSGHSNAGLVFYGFLMVLLCRYLALNKRYVLAVFVSIVFSLLIALIGASRVYLGVHYATDIIGGWSLGICLLILFISLYEFFYPIQLQFTEYQPGWGAMRKRRGWKHPQAHTDEADMIAFPKTRSAWRRPNTTARKRETEERKRQEQEEKEQQKHRDHEEKALIKREKSEVKSDE
jgi:undecaprenyl-diphosphatase